MAFLSMLSILCVLFTCLLCRVSGGSVQFFQQDADLKFTVSTTSASSSADLLFQISAPVHAGWGAVGAGDQMAGSMMFILVPNGSDNATVSVRRASDEVTPTLLSGVDYTVQSAGVNGSQMYASVICRRCTSWSGGTLDTSSTQSPWIWAIGPGSSGGGSSSSKERRASSGASSSPPGADVQIQQHSQYGTFVLDMTAAHTTTATIPSAPNGTSSTVKSSTSSSAPNHTLIILHAVLLGGAFVLLFPLGIVLLRWSTGGGSFKSHWIIQAFASLASLVGLIVAIAFSTASGEYASLSKGHQVIGIIVVAALSIQIVFGYMHHRRYKSVARRTVISYFHLWTGRVIIFMGMLNAPLGFLLSGSGSAAVLSAVAAAVILVFTVTLVVYSQYTKRRQEVKARDAAWNRRHTNNIRLVTGSMAHQGYRQFDNSR